MLVIIRGQGIINWPLSQFQPFHLLYAAGIIGFERDNYTVNEADGFVEVCLVFFQPNSGQFEGIIQLSVQSGSANDTAEGNNSVQTR